MEHPPEFDVLRLNWENGRISARKAAIQLGITHQTFLAWVAEAQPTATSGEKSTG